MNQIASYELLQDVLKIPRAGFEPALPKETDLKSVALDHSAIGTFLRTGFLVFPRCHELTLFVSPPVLGTSFNVMKSSLEVKDFICPTLTNYKFKIYKYVYFAVTNSEVAPAGLEPATLRLKAECSAELS